jgi:hypothetical protein
LIRAPRVMAGTVTRAFCPCRVGDPAANTPQARGLKQTGEVSRVPLASHK